MQTNKQPYNNNISIYFIWIVIVAFIYGFSSCGETVKPVDQLRDYQIELHMDTVWIYDGSRLVDMYINTHWDSKLDSIILKDNQ